MQNFNYTLDYLQPGVTVKIYCDDNILMNEVYYPSLLEGLGLVQLLEAAKIHRKLYHD